MPADLKILLVRCHQCARCQVQEIAAKLLRIAVSETVVDSINSKEMQIHARLTVSCKSSLT